jgi:hypothetical protein
MLEFLVLLKLLPSKTHELTCKADPEEENSEYTAINALEELELSIIIAALYYSSLLSLQNKIIKPSKRFYNK